MPKCIACERFIDLSKDEHVRLPTTNERRIEFGKIFGISAQEMLNFGINTYLCPQHFTEKDFTYDGTRINGLRRAAVPHSQQIQFNQSPRPISIPAYSRFLQPPPHFTSHAPNFSFTKHSSTDYKPNKRPSILRKQNNLPFSYSTASPIEKKREKNPLLFKKSMPLLELTSANCNNRSDFDNQSDYDFDNSFDNNIDMETPQDFMLKDYDLQQKNKRKYANDDVDDGFNFEMANLKYKKQKFEFKDEDEKSKKDVDLNGMVLIEIQQLLQLFKCCPKCGEILKDGHKIDLKIIGTAGTIYYSCPKCPNFHQTFCTQSNIPGTKMKKGNVLVASAASIAPIAYPTLKNFFELAKINIFSNSFFQRNNKNVVWPVVKNHYFQEQRNLIDLLKNMDKCSVTTDGQYDSPGFCAQICRVVAINSETGYIVAFKALQKYMTDNNSSKMELVGTKAVLNFLLDHGINVEVLTTDRHVTIRKMMEEDFSEIKHFFDSWHVIKSNVKDLREKTKVKRSGNLKLFIKPIKNHMWFSIAEGQGDGILAREILLSALFHVLNIHNWELGNISDQLYNAMENIIGKDKKKKLFFREKNPKKLGSKIFQSLEFTKITSCCHEAITPEMPKKQYMDPASWEYYYLFLQLTKENLLADYIRCSPDFTTSKVENFHSLATGRYCPKKTFFPLFGYMMRTMLAILDYNNKVKEERSGNRRVLRYVLQDSKANPGEKIRKAIKSKASTTWKHNILKDCVQVIENGFVFDDPDNFIDMQETTTNYEENSDDEAEYIENEDFIDDEITDNESESEEHEDKSVTDPLSTNIISKTNKDFIPSTAKPEAPKSKQVNPKNEPTLDNDGFDIINPNETKKTIFSAPKFIPPTQQQIQRALKIFGIDEKHAIKSPLLKLEFGTINVKNLKLHDVKKDGNCGYRALSYLLTGTEEFHWVIRLKVMSHIGENGDKIRGIWTVAVKEEFQKRYQQLADKRPRAVGDDQWAGNNDFCGFASLTNINIFVNSEKTEKWVPHIKDEGWNETDPAFFIHHINRNHFMAVDGI